MSNKIMLDEDLFRAQLRQTLEEVQVSDSLRNQTLEACRSYLETNSSAAAPESRRLLPFAGRHATFFRIAGGLAAGVLLFLMVLDVLPRMGSASPAAFTVRGNNDTMSMSAGASMEAAADEAPAYGVAANSASAAAQPAEHYADTAPAGAEAPNAEAAEAAIASDGVAFTDSETGAGDFAIKAAPQSAFLLSGGSPWASYDAGSSPQPLGESPDVALVEAALSVLEEEYGIPYAGIAVKAASDDGRTRALPVLHLAAPLSRETLVAATSYQQLLGVPKASEDARTESAGEPMWAGLWMLPVFSADGAAMIPLRAMADAASAPGVIAEPPLPVENGEAWLQLLTQEDLLRQSLSEACGSEVTAWQIIDVEGGRGFWVGWQADGTEWIMPFLDNPARMGLENGRAYSWEALVAIVEPLF